MASLISFIWWTSLWDRTRNSSSLYANIYIYISYICIYIYSLTSSSLSFSFFFFAMTQLLSFSSLSFVLILVIFYIFETVDEEEEEGEEEEWEEEGGGRFITCSGGTDRSGSIITMNKYDLKISTNKNRQIKGKEENVSRTQRNSDRNPNHSDPSTPIPKNRTGFLISATSKHHNAKECQQEREEKRNRDKERERENLSRCCPSSTNLDSSFENVCKARYQRSCQHSEVGP